MPTPSSVGQRKEYDDDVSKLQTLSMLVPWLRLRFPFLCLRLRFCNSFRLLTVIRHVRNYAVYTTILTTVQFASTFIASLIYIDDYSIKFNKKCIIMRINLEVFLGCFRFDMFDNISL